MKLIIYFLLIPFILCSCSKLTDVLERTPPNNLTPENVVATKQGAENLLNGTYAMLHDQYYYMHSEIVPSVMGGFMRRNTFPLIAFQDNTLTPLVADVRNIWMAFYKVINQANWVIRLVDQLPGTEATETEKRSMKAQARGLRAMAHFDALRYFGQFYDLNSPFGIVLREQPSDYTNREIPRSTVAQSYERILSDLDEAIAADIPFQRPVLFSSLAAKALKAKVLLFMARYKEAETLAHEVITDGARSLAPDFRQVFSSGFNSTEMIFMRATDAVTRGTDRKQYTYGNGACRVGTWLKNLMQNDPRAAVTYNSANDYLLKVYNTDFNVPTYFMRLAEMYLIEAECLARTNAPLEEAKAPLEVIRQRAFGSPQPSLATTHEELLEEIFNEIVKELCHENGSDWFAAIRFGKAQTIKPSITSENQYHADPGYRNRFQFRIRTSESRLRINSFTYNS